MIQDFFLYQEPDERKRWKEVIAFPVPAGLWRKLGGSLEVQAMGEAPQATGFPMGMVGAMVNPLLSAVRASLTLSFSLELLQVIDNSWNMSRENISYLPQELGVLVVNCPTRQSLLLIIGSLHRFPYSNNKEI